MSAFSAKHRRTGQQRHEAHGRQANGCRLRNEGNQGDAIEQQHGPTADGSASVARKLSTSLAAVAVKVMLAVCQPVNPPCLGRVTKFVCCVCAPRLACQ